MSFAVVGVDPSLNFTAIAEASGDVRVARADKRRGVERLEYVANEVLRAVHAGRQLGTCGLVIEGYSYGSQGQSVYDIGELGGVLRFVLHKANVPVLVVSPSQLKVWGTGKGTANKTEMVLGARARLGYEGTDHNEADALLLRSLGLALLGDEHSMPKLHRRALGPLQEQAWEVRMRALRNVKPSREGLFR